MTIKKIIAANNYKNGTLVTAVDKFGNSDKIDPSVNQTYQIPIQTGVLDGRFNDYTYYTA